MEITTGKKLSKEDIISKFPELFEECFEYSIGHGWNYLIYIFCLNLSKDSKILQIKEKFGGLRVYIKSKDERDNLLNKLIENLSFEFCENCGTCKEVDTRGDWILTLCETCRKLYGIQNE